MCLYPRLIQNPKYKANKKNGGNIPAVNDNRVKLVPIGCQQCIECRKQKAREWQIRLQEEIKTAENGKFITLTFNQESLSKIQAIIKEKRNIEGYQLENEIATYAIRHWLERWRKKYKKSIRHWLITELGDGKTEHIHLHGIIWTDKPIEEIENTWQYGYIWPKPGTKAARENYVNAKTVNYIIKYVTKTDEKHKHYKSIILTSPGIGHNYTKQPIGDWQKKKYKEGETDETYRTSTGHKIALPTYYRNKIYTEEEREKLWIEKINKEERYVLGQKIKINKGEEEYKKALKEAQQKNKELGYGDPSIKWNEQEYELQRRILIQKDRIQNAG